MAHQDDETKEAQRFGGAQPGAGRKRLPRPDEVARQLIEANRAVVLRPFFRTLGYEIIEGDEGLRLEPTEGGGAKLYGTRQSTGDIVVSPHDDLGAQQTAGEKLWHNVYGRPRQAVEVTGEDGGPIQTQGIDLSGLEPGELRALRELLRKAGA